MVNFNKMKSVKDQYKILHLSTTKQNTGRLLTYSLGNLTWQQILFMRTSLQLPLSFTASSFGEAALRAHMMQFPDGSLTTLEDWAGSWHALPHPSSPHPPQVLTRR